jgi:hypothetical protein
MFLITRLPDAEPYCALDRSTFALVLLALRAAGGHAETNREIDRDRTIFAQCAQFMAEQAAIHEAS